jgi:hypothetical protein
MSKKKITNPTASMEELLQRAVQLAEAPFTPSRTTELPSLRSVAEELGTTVIRTRKLLITANYFTSPLSSTVQRLKSEGKAIEKIGAALHLKPAAVYGYLPYEHRPYNLPETTSNADRHKRYRATKKLKAVVDTGSTEKISAVLWRCVIVFENYPLSTNGCGSRNGVEYTYQVSRKGGSGGRHYSGNSIPGYGNELWLTVDGEKKEKSISRSTVELGFQKYLEVLESGEAMGPKKLGVFGASYLLPLFQRFYPAEAASSHPGG